MKHISTIVFFCFFLIACNSETSSNKGSSEKKIVIDQVFDYQNRLLVTYFYDSNKLLTKRAFSDPDTGYKSDLKFEYENKKPTRILFEDQNFSQFNYQIKLYYNRQMLSYYRNFEYDNKKRPSCGLDYVFQIDLLPKMGDYEIFERNISENNKSSITNRLDLYLQPRQFASNHRNKMAKFDNRPNGASHQIQNTIIKC
jgi:hypothetical protein